VFNSGLLNSLLGISAGEGKKYLEKIQAIRFGKETN
jgi:hypothetical protein